MTTSNPIDSKARNGQDGRPSSGSIGASLDHGRTAAGAEVATDRVAELAHVVVLGYN
jgi:hypothetical protein